VRKRALRLAVVYPSFGQAGGAENHSIAACAALARRGHAVTLVTSSYDEALFPARAGLPFAVRTVGGRGLFAGPADLPALMRRVAALAADADLVLPVNFPASAWTLLCRPPRVWLCLEPKRNLYPDIMYAEAPGFGPHGFRPSGLRAALRDPHLLLPFGARAGLQRALDQHAARGMRAILTNSPSIAGKCAQVYPHMAGRIHTTWAPVEMPDAAGRAYQPFVLVPTRLEPIKNVDVVLRAAARLRDTGAPGGWRVVVMGDGDARAGLEAQALALGLGDSVTFTGYVPREERERLYATCGFIVYPALAEPLGLPVAEAAMHHKPSIADRHGGPADMIAHGETGLLADMTDEAALTDALGGLMARPDDLPRLGDAAAARLAPLMAEPGWGDAFEALLLRWAGG
jgi:glycosyltransferase involved in cell wall biosynthesis